MANCGRFPRPTRGRMMLKLLPAPPSSTQNQPKANKVIKYWRGKEAGLNL